MAIDKSASVEMARLAYSTARDEILERMKQRELITLAYVAGCITLLTASVSSDTTDKQFFLSCVNPVAALIVSVLLYAHNRTIEDLAKFIRYPLNNFLIATNAWAPVWDVNTRWNDRPGSIGHSGFEKGKTFWRRMAVLFSIHLPSVIALCLANYHFRNAKAESLLLGPAPLMPQLTLGAQLLFLAAVAAFFAFIFTIQSFRLRHDPKLPEIRIPDEYESLRQSYENSKGNVTNAGSF